MYYVIRFTWKHLIFIIYSLIVCWTIKAPLYDLVSLIISNPIVNFVLVMLCSFLVSMFTRKIFKSLVKKMVSYDSFLNAYIIDTVISFIINIFNRLGFKRQLCSIDSKGSPLYANWINDPFLNSVSPSHAMATLMNSTSPSPGELLRIRGDNIYHRIRRLEPLVSGLRRDNPNSAMVLALDEHTASSKKELKNCMRTWYQGEGPDLFVPREWHTYFYGNTIQLLTYTVTYTVS